MIQCKIIIFIITPLIILTSLLLVSCSETNESSEFIDKSPISIPIKTTTTEKQSLAIDTDKITLITSDNIKLTGTYYNSNSEKAIILVHMLNNDRTSWEPFASDLQKKYTVLSTDLRGHGESELDWRKFDFDGFNKMSLDVKAAKEFLIAKNKTDIALIGASIGANIALKYAASDPEIRTAILLSPGENYKGIKPYQEISAIDRPLLIVASEGDEYSASSSFMLNTRAPNSKLVMYKFGHHGTRMLGKDLGIESEIFDWLEKYI